MVKNGTRFPVKNAQKASALFSQAFLNREIAKLGTPTN